MDLNDFKETTAAENKKADIPTFTPPEEDNAAKSIPTFTPPEGKKAGKSIPTFTMIRFSF